MSRERTDMVRAALKRDGYTTRQVSVRGDGNRDVTVTIRDASVRLRNVVAIVAPICPDREYYGDGQPFMAPTYDVRYAPEIVQPIADAIVARVTARPVGEVVPIAFARVSVEARGEVHRHDAGAKGHYCAGLAYGARRLASELLDVGCGVDDLDGPRSDEWWTSRLDLLDPATATMEEIRDRYPCIRDRPIAFRARMDALLAADLDMSADDLRAALN